jgi:hypothetical protein
VKGSYKILHNENVNNLCPPKNKIRMIKSRRMRLVRHVDGMEV